MIVTLQLASVVRGAVTGARGVVPGVSWGMGGRGSLSPAPQAGDAQEFPFPLAIAF